MVNSNGRWPRCVMWGNQEKKKRPVREIDRPRVVPGLPGSSRTAVQPQGYTGLAIVPFTIGVNAVRLSCMAALPRP
jgi:hypothetical protein